MNNNIQYHNEEVVGIINLKEELNQNDVNEITEQCKQYQIRILSGDIQDTRLAIKGSKEDMEKMFNCAITEKEGIVFAEPSIPDKLQTYIKQIYFPSEPTYLG